MITCMTQNRVAHPPPTLPSGRNTETARRLQTPYLRLSGHGCHFTILLKNTLGCIHLSSTLVFFTSSSCLSDTSLSWILVFFVRSKGSNTLKLTIFNMIMLMLELVYFLFSGSLFFPILCETNQVFFFHPFSLLVWNFNHLFLFCCWLHFYF